LCVESNWTAPLCAGVEALADFGASKALSA
jgi:hypothetical protein